MTKTKSFRTILSMAMVVAIVLSLSCTAFAANPVTNQRVWIYNKQNVSPNLNASTSGTPADYTNVTMWSNTGSNTQRWTLDLVDSSNRLYVVRNYANTTVGLNIYRDGTNNCNLFNIASNSANDKNIRMVDESSYGSHYFGFVLPAYTLCLTPTGFTDGANVTWQAPNGTTNQIWRVYPN